MANAITTPALLINNEVIDIVPNSLSFTRGVGTRTVKPQSAGGSQLTNVTFVNVEEAKGHIKFKVYNTEENISKIQTIQDAFDANVAQFTSKEGLNGTMQNAIIINDPEFVLGADSTTEVEMQGLTIQ